jgi:hypothetical protein
VLDGGLQIDDRAKSVLGEETEFATWNLHHVIGAVGRAGLGVRKGCTTISDDADCLGGRYRRLDGIEDCNGSAQRLHRFPSSTSRSADTMSRVVERPRSTAALCHGRAGL